jgi:RNA polymerase sigma factor (sigma-70 family)
VVISAESLIKEYGHMVSSVCRRTIQDPDTARDAAQQAWLEIIKSLPGFRGDARVSTWIYSITYRVVLDFARNERKYSARFLHDYFNRGDMELPQYEDFDKELWVKEMCDKCLTGMLHCLDNEARLTYLFKDIARLTYGEIARIQERDEQTVRQSVSRTRRKLRNFLKDECVLFNPSGTCHCRMKKWVEEINLPQEYKKLRAISQSVNLYQESETVLSR